MDSLFEQVQEMGTGIAVIHLPLGEEFPDTTKPVDCGVLGTGWIQDTETRGKGVTQQRVMKVFIGREIKVDEGRAAE